MSDKTSLPSGITASSGGDAQYWSWNELYGVLYWLKHVGSKEHIISYDPLSNVFVDNTTIINHIAGSTLSNDYACVASFEHNIFVIGGFSPTMDCGGCGQPFLFIYDRSSNVWSTGSNMKHGRRSHQCAVDLNNQVLFAIGGWNKEDGFVSSVETIAINNINNDQWSDSEPLLDAVVGAPSIFYDHFIFVIAGHSVSVGINNQMQIIDCDNNGQVSRGPYLYYAVSNHAPVIVNDVLYVFGGKDTGSSPVNTWQYLELTGTNAPTLRTSAPTNIPTANPSTRNPTHNPTVAPTTSNPSNSPSNLPTITPTLFPTTPSPTTPEPLSCPAETVGDYNNEAISFKVNVEKEGSLTFDASDSDFVVNQIDAVYGFNTPQGYNDDGSGILVIDNALPGPYTFTIRADEGIYSIFNISVWCEFISTSSPTRIPTLIPTLYPSQSMFEMTVSTEQERSEQSNTKHIGVYEQWWFYVLALLFIAAIVFGVIYVHRKRIKRSEKQEKQVQIDLEREGDIGANIDNIGMDDTEMAYTVEGPSDMMPKAIASDNKDENQKKQASHSSKDSDSNVSFDGMFVGGREVRESEGDLNGPLHFETTKGNEIQPAAVQRTKGDDYYDQYLDMIYANKKINDQPK
eukprot:730956_1